MYFTIILPNERFDDGETSQIGLDLEEVIHFSISVKIIGNYIDGSVKVDDLDMSLKRSQIGNLHMYHIRETIKSKRL